MNLYLFLPPPTNESNMLGNKNESVEADKKREAIKDKENDCIKEGEEKEKESMLCSYDDLFSRVLPLDNNCIQKPPMIQPKKQQLHYIIREEESIHLSHSWLSRSICFEKQFGWDKLLETKLGNWHVMGMPHRPNFWLDKLGENISGYYGRRSSREEINGHHQRT